MSASREISCAREEEQPPSVSNEGSDSNNKNNNIPMGNGTEENNVDKRHSSRRYDRHDAGHYDNMSDDESEDSLCGTMTTTARKSRRMQPADAYECVNGGLGDCAQCRKQRASCKKRRSRRRKSRSRSCGRRRRRRSCRI